MWRKTTCERGWRRKEPWIFLCFFFALLIPFVFFLFFYPYIIYVPPPHDTHGLDIAVGCSPSYGKGLLALLKSISVNSDPNSIKVWIFSEEQDVEEFEIMIKHNATFFPKHNMRILPFQTDPYLLSLLSLLNNTNKPTNTANTNTANITHHIYSHQKETGDQKHPAEYMQSLVTDHYNYIRFYMPSLFQSLLPASERPSKYLYLDCDTLVLKDPRVLVRSVGGFLGSNTSVIAKSFFSLDFFWGKNHSDKNLENVCLAASRRVEPKMRYFFDKKFIKQVGLRPNYPAFNAGVLLIDTNCWIRNQILNKTLFWIKFRTENKKLYQGGSQGPLLLTFYPIAFPLSTPHPSSSPFPLTTFPRPLPYIEIDQEWNVEGRNYQETIYNVNCTAILHLSGGKKPWDYKLIYQPYVQKAYDLYAPEWVVKEIRPHSVLVEGKKKTNFQCKLSEDSTRKSVISQLI